MALIDKARIDTPFADAPVKKTSPAPLYFLLSSPRAGSTLLTRIMDSHSALASPCEICLPYVVRGSWKVFRSVQNLYRICRHYAAPAPTMPGNLFLRSTARRELDQLVRAILDRERKQTLVIKDARHANHVERIESLLADAPPRYILLHRDARAVAHSFANTLHKRPSRCFRAWAESTRAMLRIAATLPASRYHVIRFEDMLANPTERIRDLIEFMGLTFEPDMLDYGQFTHTDDKMNLWSDERRVVSVRTGVIEPSQQQPWETNEAILRAYAARPDIQELNQALGYK